MIALLRLLSGASRRALPLAVALGVASGVAMTGLLALISHCIAHRKDPRALAAYIGVAVLLLATRFFSRRSVVSLSERALADLRKRIVRSVLKAPMRQLESLGTPKLLAALTDDMLVLSTGLFALYSALVDLVVIVACLVYLALLSFTVSVVLSCFIVLGGVGFLLGSAAAGRHLARARDAQDVLFEGLEGAVAGAKELKLSAPRRKDFLRFDLDGAAESFRELQTRGRTSYDASALIGFAVLLLAIGVILFVMSSDMMAQTLSAYVLTTIYMNSALDTLFGTLPLVARAEAILERLKRLGLDLAPDVTDPASDGAPVASPVASWKSIELRSVCHSYQVDGDARPFGLDEISLTLEPGEITFLIGGNGSGKSTLVKVLVGLYIPESGTICVDGEPVTDATREIYRQNFSAVFADYHLFKRLPGHMSPEIQKRAEGYLKKLKLSHKVEIVDGRFSSTNLSSGQRKRLALVSAYVEDRRVYVFDEWASDQDPRFRELFYTDIVPDLARRGKAVLCVTHDEKYFLAANKRIKLDAGRIDNGDTNVFLKRLSLPEA